MHWARRMAVAGSLLTGLIGVPALLATSASAARVEDCKTIVTNVNRPDNGHGTGGTGQPGYWADMSVKRTTVVCLVGPVAGEGNEGKANYTATMTEVGSLVTRAGANLSPNNGLNLTGGVKGKVEGGWKVDLVAPAAWGGWVGNFNGDTVSCANKTKACEWTADKNGWAARVYGEAGVAETTEKGTYAWGWKYWICADTFMDARKVGPLGWWWDAENTNDGMNDAPGPNYAGDILAGRTCPSASPSSSASASPTIAPPTTTPVANDGLPVTGASVGKLIAIGAIVIVVGGAAVLVGRRRRTKFVA